MSKPCCYAMVEGVDPFRLHHTSMSYIHLVFQAPSTDVDGLITAHSHRYHRRRFPRFGRVPGQNPRL